MGELAVTTGKSNVFRQSDGKGYVDWIREGRQVTILDSDGKWSKVKVIGGDYDGHILWTWGGNLSGLSHELAVTTCKSNVFRRAEGKGYVDWIKKGRQVAIVDSYEKWSKVKIIGGDQDGEILWVWGENLESLTNQGNTGNSNTGCLIFVGIIILIPAIIRFI